MDVQGDPRADREWEHWPGRRTTEDGIRHRLKALFSATDDEDSVEALIVERGREIEQRTEQLQVTISDLERREEQTGQLRSAVEEMLRHGSAELDERHAELAAMALDLRARDEKVRVDERDIAVRKQELGAVELLRAAVERREKAATDRERVLEQIAAELASRELQLAAAERRDVVAGPDDAASSDRDDVAEPDLSAHVLYLAGNGYRMVERDGVAARVDALLEVDGEQFVVTRVGRSPLPGDRRAWAYLEPINVHRHDT
jgi:hypothetical protein